MAIFSQDALNPGVRKREVFGFQQKVMGKL